MDGTPAIALSGMQAAALRTSVAAENLVKAGAAGFATDARLGNGDLAPKRVEQIGLASGGVVAQVRPAPEGIVFADMATEMVKLQIADASYRAAAAVFDTASAMGRSQLDILA